MKGISIILPVYNGAGTIRRCLDSIMSSTYRDVEIIVVNDGSTDDTLKTCEEYVNRCVIKCCNVTQRSGVCYARNVGLQIATRDHIYFADADDEVLPDGLNALLRHSSYDLVIGNFEVIQRGVTIGIVPLTPVTLNREQLLARVFESFVANDHGMFLGLWNKLYSTRIIRDYNIRFNLHVDKYTDGQFNLDYLLYATSCTVIPDRVYRYRTECRNYGFNLINVTSMLNKIEWFINQTNPARPDSLILNAYKFFLNRELGRYNQAIGRSKWEYLSC